MGKGGDAVLTSLGKKRKKREVVSPRKKRKKGKSCLWSGTRGGLGESVQRIESLNGKGRNPSSTGAAVPGAMRTTGAEPCLGGSTAGEDQALLPPTCRSRRVRGNGEGPPEGTYDIQRACKSGDTSVFTRAGKGPGVAYPSRKRGSLIKLKDWPESLEQ